MHASITLKQQFLKKWLVGLQACTSSKKNMDVLERKRAIKLSADLAMASTRNGTTRWSRAIIEKSGQPAVERVVDRAAFRRGGSYRRKKMVVRKIRNGVCCKVRKRNSNFSQSKVLASSIAKRLVGKRRKVLKSLVPGGEGIEDEVLLIEETLDYISFLRAQVDVMRCVADKIMNHS